ncbi:MAG: RNase H family protein [Blastocatellia bacterium]
MGYLFEEKLRARAGVFIAALKGEGITGAIIENSFRDYTVKLDLSFEGGDHGHVNLYYSPKSNTFSLKTHELKNKSLVAQLEACWHDEPKANPSPGRGWQMYVDGSYINGATGYGTVILKDGAVVAELCGPVAAAEVNGTRQVAGELRAAEEGLLWCQQHQVGEVEIFYDYYGVEKWATGAWKTNQPLTQGYARTVRESGVRTRWRKVAAHTGNRWNERADHLAKQGARSAKEARAPGDEEPQATADPLMTELLEKQERFIEFLMVKGIDAAFDRLYNDQFARLLIRDEDEKCLGYFDLYHTRRKPLSPYLHAFKDRELKSRLEALWREFTTTTDLAKEEATTDEHR